MWQKTILKMLWFKNNYLSIDSELNILNIGSLMNNIDTDFHDIFNEKRWTYEKLFFDKKNINEYMEVWEKIPNSTYDVIISHNYLKFNHTSEFIIENMKRTLKNNGIFCFFILPGEKLDNNQDKENYANEILFLFKNQLFEIKHFSDNSIYSSQKNFEYCIIGSKKEEQNYGLKELKRIMHKQTKENEELKTKLTNQKQLNEEIKTKLTSQNQLYEELNTKLINQKQLNEEIEELKTKLTNQKQLNEEIEELKTKLTSQKQLNEELNTKFTSQNQLYEELNTKLTSQKQLNEEIKTKLTSQNQLYEELNTKLTSQKQLNEEIEELKTKLTNQKQLNEEINTKLTSQNQLNEEINTKLTSQNQLNEKIKTKLTSQIIKSKN